MNFSVNVLDAAPRPHEAEAHRRPAVSDPEDAATPEFLNTLLNVLGVETKVSSVDAAAEQERADAEVGADEADAPDSSETADAATARVDRDVSRLSPAFRTRLDRVMARMREEHGHDVRLVEGYRGQARQDALYEQGRTQPGPVVTWTRASAHTDGRAADLLVDGDYDNPEGYARLAQVAREEGLRTLGPRDAGHVELPADAGGGEEAGEPHRAAGARSAAIKATGWDGTGAALAASRSVAVAAPAAVAQPRLARVASVAQVAVPGAHAADPAGAGETGDGQAPTTAGAAGAARSASSDASGAESMPNDMIIEELELQGGGRRAGGVPEAELGEDSDVVRPLGPIGSGVSGDDSLAGGNAESRVDAATNSVMGAGGTESHARSPGAGGGPAAVGGSPDAARQLERVLGAQESAARQPLSRVTLQLGEADGGSGRVRVDLRGLNVDAEIALDDAGSAALLNDRMDELSHALQRQGLDPEILRARAADPLTEAGNALRMAGRLAEPEAVGPTSRSADHGGRDDPGGSGQRDDEDSARRESGSNGHRSHKEHNERGTS